MELGLNRFILNEFGKIGQWIVGLGSRLSGVKFLISLLVFNNFVNWNFHRALLNR